MYESSEIINNWKFYMASDTFGICFRLAFFLQSNRYWTDQNRRLVVCEPIQDLFFTFRLKYSVSKPVTITQKQQSQSSCTSLCNLHWKNSSARWFSFLYLNIIDFSTSVIWSQLDTKNRVKREKIPPSIIWYFVIQINNFDTINKLLRKNIN